MKKLGLLFALCMLACLLAVPAMAEAQGLPVIHITYAPDAVLSQEEPVEAQITLTQDGQENTFAAALRLNDESLDFCEQLLPQKSLRIDGEDTRFILYNDGNDAIYTKIISSVCRSLIAQSSLGVAYPAQEPVEVYLNGEYWGLYTKREVTEDAIARFEGLNGLAALNVRNVNKDPICGDVSGVTEALKRIKELDLSREEDVQTLIALLDADSFLNWLAVNAYFGTGNLYTEVVFYQIGDGPVKCAMGDFAYALLYSNENPFASLNNPPSYEADALVLARKLLAQPVYRAAFLIKLGTLYQELPTSAMQAAVDAENAKIASALPAHMNRWADEFARARGDAVAYPVANAQETELFQQYRVYRLREQTLVRRPWYLYDYTQQAFSLSDEEMARYFVGPKPEKPEVNGYLWEDYKAANPD